MTLEKNICFGVSCNIPQFVGLNNFHYIYHHQQVCNVYNIFLCPVLSFDSLLSFISILPVTILKSPVFHQIHKSLYQCLLRSPCSFPPIWNPLQTSHWQSIFSHPLHITKPLQLFIFHKLYNCFIKIHFFVG